MDHAQVECRLSSVVVAPALRNWKHLLPLKIILMPISNEVHYQLLLCVDTSDTDEMDAYAINSMYINSM